MGTGTERGACPRCASGARNAALIGCLSLAGAVWVGPLLLGALVFAVVTGSARNAAIKAAVLVVLVAVMVIPVLIGDSLIPPTSSPLDDPNARGNLIEPLSALQALGIWPAGDFRVDADQMAITIALCAFAAGAAVAGWVVAVRGRRWDVAAYVVGVPVAALAIFAVGSPWVDGKAFAIASPVLLFSALLGCMWAWSERRFVLGAGVAALIGLGVVWSNALAYSEVNLAPRDQLSELEEIGEMLEGAGPVLMTEYQPYGVRHFLRDSDPEGASELRRRLVPLADGSSLEKGLWADTDEFRADAFEPYEALILRRSPEQSRPPGDFKLKKAGEFYEVWVRDAGVTSATERLPLGSGRSPVSVPECADVRELARSVPGGHCSPRGPASRSSWTELVARPMSKEVPTPSGSKAPSGVRPRSRSTGRRPEASGTSSTTKACTPSSAPRTSPRERTRSRFTSSAATWLQAAAAPAITESSRSVPRPKPSSQPWKRRTSESCAARPGTGSKPGYPPRRCVPYGRLDELSPPSRARPR